MAVVGPKNSIIIALFVQIVGFLLHKIVAFFVQIIGFSLHNYLIYIER